MKVLFLEAFYGGSHQDVADGICRHSRHTIDLYTLPARFWKWRMRGAALYFIQAVKTLSAYDALLVSDLMSLSDFKALAGGRLPPALVYFHENQLTYPVAREEVRDVHFGFTDITSALAADRVLFNSRTHCRRFFAHLPGFLRQMPDFRPSWVIDEIRGKTAVCHPGCQFSTRPHPLSPRTQAPPLVIWNHRWEHDKQPDVFFAALEKIEDKGIDFRLAVLGETYETVPGVFETAKCRFASKIRHWGYAADKAAYHDWLGRGSIVISTAIQENFGISIIEAVRFGCLPLLPNRLSYPEVLPGFAHAACLYESVNDLVEKLAHMLTYPEAYEALRCSLSRAMAAYAWESRIAAMDQELDRLAATVG